MSECDRKPTGVLGVATSGIQDVSALLPLLGTEQCEKQVALALDRGLLYAAATPMSIFGSLGIVKAGFVVLWTSIDVGRFRGPTQLRNAGFVPSGVGALLTCRGDGGSDLYIAEDKLQRILAKKQIRSVKVDVLSRDMALWNTRLVCATVSLSSFGLIPYIFLITQTLSDRPFRATWLYPIIRIAGCSLVAVTIQFILQLRLLDELYCRVRFMAADRYMKRHRIPIPPFWNTNHRSKNSLKGLSSHDFGDQIVKAAIMKEDLGTWTSFSFYNQARLKRHPTANLGQVETGSLDTTSAPKFIPAPDVLLCACQISLVFGLGLAVVGYVGCFSVVQASPRADSTGPLLWLVLEALLAISRTLLWAYNPRWDDAKSPIVLEKEVVGGIDGQRDGGQREVAGRNESPGKLGLKTEGGIRTSSFAIGWNLSSVTADNMHAVIVGINEFESDLFPSLISCVSDAEKVRSYLEDTLLVPRDQVVTLLDAEATKARIVDELEALSHRPSVEQNAPIIIYFATHSFMQATSKDIITYLVPHDAVEKPDPYSNQQAVQAAYIQYNTIRDLIQRIAAEKTDNITVILDTCHAGSLGTRYGNCHGGTLEPLKSVPPHRFQWPDSELGAELKKVGVSTRGDSEPMAPQETDVFSQDSSHVVLAGTSGWGQALELPNAGGLFTESLIRTLSDKEQDFKKMTYKELIEKTNVGMTKQWDEFKSSNAARAPEISGSLIDRFRQKAQCTSYYEDQLVFSGLLARRVTDGDIHPFIKIEYSDV